MAAGLDSQRLDIVFGSRPDILSGIRQAADTPARITLFNEIASFVHDKLSSDEPASKRRRVDTNGAVAVKQEPAQQPLSRTLTLNAADVGSEPVLLEIKEISVSVPQRKKYDLCFTANHLYARVPGTTAPAQGIVYAWRDIAHVFFLPVPEKTQVQHNYVIIPKGACLPASKTAAPADEPLVFTIPASPPKNGTVVGPKAQEAATVSDSYQALFHWAINTHLRASSNKASIVASDPNVFHSASRQNVRPGEKPVHVKAFRGSKDGYLFFLPTGILWAFKKPLLFVPLDRVVAVSYTNVLQRTFNVLVEVFLTPGEGEAEGATEEIEFAMLDQEDYNGIDQNYVRRHKLQDRSMAEQRKAKLELAENKPGKKDGDEAGAADDDAEADEGAKASGEFEGLSALQIAEMEAERQLQDEEDELEEDYEPSGDDSDGSGSSSEEDDDDEDGEAAGEAEDDEEEEEAEAEDEEEEEEKVPEKKVPEKKVPEKKVPEKKVPEKKVPEKKVPEKKVPEKKAPEKKVPAKQAPAKQPPAKQAAKQAPVKQAPVEPEDEVMAEADTVMTMGARHDDDEDEHLDIGM